MEYTENGNSNQQKENGLLFGIGNPLLDILAKVAPGYVKKWNLELNSQINAEVEHDGLFDEVTNYFEVEYVPGGCTLNTVRVCQWMSGLENSTVFSGSIGNDRFGEILNRNIQRQRVKTRLFKVDNDCTGRAVSLITKGGNRSIVGLIAAANKYTEENLDSIWNEQVAVSDFFYQSSWFLLSDFGVQIYKRLGSFASNNQKHFGLNLSAPTLCENHLDKILQIYPYSNFLFGNNTEAAAFSKAMGWNKGEDQLEEIARLMVEFECEKGERIVIITSGPRETLVASRKLGVQRFSVLPVDPKAVIDTTGAGDAFCGGFIASILQQRLSRSQLNKLGPIQLEAILSEAIQSGNYAAREIIQRYGCAVPNTCNYKIWKNLDSDKTESSFSEFRRTA